MGYVLAIDPGRDQGWSVYHVTMALGPSGKPTFSGSTLVNCGLGDVPPQALPESPLGVVIEKPEVYADRAMWKGDPNNLVTLGIRVGRALERYGEGKTTLVLPKTWKGQVPKEVHHARAKTKLTEIELARLARCVGRVAVSKQHNVLDAVALGLWYLGRLGR